MHPQAFDTAPQGSQQVVGVHSPQGHQDDQHILQHIQRQVQALGKRAYRAAVAGDKQEPRKGRWGQR